MAEQSLKDKTIKGTIWSGIDQVVQYAVSFVVGIVLARLLSPAEYGLIGIILIFTAISDSIVDGGFSNALIRKKDVGEEDYNTVFIINLAVSFLLTALLFTGAPLIAKFFCQPQLTELTRAMSAVVIINALAIIPKTRLVKSIDFKTQTKISFIASIISGVVGIVMAFCGCGVWSLVAQQLVRQFLNTSFLFIFNRWIPKLIFSVAHFKDLWNFGWKLLASNLINTTWNEIYQVVIGKFYTPISLGEYSRAKQFAGLASTNITTVVQRVSYPVLSSIQDNKKRLKDAYQRIIRITMLISFMLMFCMMGSAKPMILALLGEKWVGAVPMLQIVCLNMMLYPLHAINLNMLQVQGRSDLFFKLEIIKKIIAVGPLLLGIFVSIYWMLIGSVIVGIISYWLNAYYSGPFLDYSVKDQIVDILPSFGVSLFVGLIVYVLSFIPITPYVLFPIQIVVGYMLAFLICEKIKLPEFIEIKGIVVDCWNKTR